MSASSQNGRTHPPYYTTDTIPVYITYVDTVVNFLNKDSSIARHVGTIDGYEVVFTMDGRYFQSYKKPALNPNRLEYSVPPVQGVFLDSRKRYINRSYIVIISTEKSKKSH